MTAAAPPPTPTIIAGRYELRRRLAQGGMAEVWLAVDLTLDRKVAVKWLKPSLATDPVVAERFRREAIAAASLSHPNIVAVHDVFEEDGRQAVVMQLVDGKSLRQVLDNKKRLSPQLTCHIGSCVAAALDHAHRAGFIHRDVKPGNIMITPDGQVLLTDFGIAKGLHGTEDDLTSDNVMMGTAKYLSPEQVRGKRLDGRADLYSLGLVLYECLAGRVPFLGETDADTALARLQRDPTDLTRLRATLPTGLVITIHQLLARNPDQRPAGGAELAGRLRAAAEEGPPPIDETPAGDSPVGPYTVGRLRRAPSDVPGQLSDRRRTSRSPRDAPIPGEVVTTAGQHGTDPTPGDHVAARPEVRDATPAEGAPRRGRTAKGLSNGVAPAGIVVAVLVVAALVIGSLIWATNTFGGETASPVTTVLPADANAEPEQVAPAEPDVDEGAGAPDDPAVSSDAEIVSITAYDPAGDGIENDGEATRALADGDAATAWRTLCYSSQFMGGKPGVGLVVSFDAPTTQPVSVEVGTAPYQLQFFASASEQVPSTLDGWDEAIGEKSFGSEPATVVSGQPGAPARHVLLLLNELGPDPACSSSNPYRGYLSEIALR